MEERPEADEGPFQKEERRLIDAIAERLGKIIEFKQAEVMLQEAHDELEQRVEERTAELRRLSCRLVEVQENERKRIAFELHDSIGQYLAAIKLGLGNAISKMPEYMNKKSVELFESLMPLVQEVSDEVRRIPTDLRPSLLDDLGIIVTLSWFCREFERLHLGLRIEKQINIEERELPEPLKIVIFRLVQEALNNVSKHTKADLVRLSINKTDSKIELLIEDNGQGFTVEYIRSADKAIGGVGLGSMKDRTQLSGGSFSIDSTKGEGTTVRASWPKEQ